MPTIKQLPAATAVGGSDLLPLSQNGLTRSTAVSTLLSNTQPLLSLAPGTLLGRVSAGLGGPEALSVGNGLSVQSGTVIATSRDHVGLPLATSLLTDDEVVVNSGVVPKRLPVAQLRSLFSAGAGVQIDGNGVISSSSTSNPPVAGAIGPKGDTGNQGPAGQGFAFRGQWQANTRYSPYDVVTNGGQVYVATVAVPASSTFVTSSWALFAAQGATGPAGAVGPAGLGIATAIISGQSQLLLTRTDGTTLNAGTLPAGPAGSPGAQGAIGPQGPVGPAGQQGPAGAGGSGTVSPGATGQLAYFAANGTMLSGLALGAGLSISAGTLSSSGGGNSYVLPIATASTLGGVKSTATIAVASDGTVSLGQNGATNGQVLQWNGAAYIPATVTGGGASYTGAAPVVIAGSTISVATGTTANTLATGNDSRIVGALQPSAIPAASGALLGGSGAPGVASTIAVGSGLLLSSNTLSAAASPLTGVSINGTTIAGSTATPYQMLAADRIVDVNKTNGAATRIILPSSPTFWVEYTVVDGKGDAGTNNITIAAPSGGTVNGAASFVMNANNDAITLRAVSATTWRIT